MSHLIRVHAWWVAWVMSVSLQPCGLYPAWLPCSWTFSRQEYWGGLLCPPPRDLLDSGMEPMSLMSPASACEFFTVVKPKDKRTGKNKTKQRGPWSAGTENPVPYRPPPCTHVVTINKFQVLWSNITCLPLLPHTEKVFALLFPHPASVPHPVSKRPARPLTGTL